MAGHKVILACIGICFGCWGIIVDATSFESNEATIQTNSQVSGNEQRSIEVKDPLEAWENAVKSGYLGGPQNHANELHIHQSGTLHLRLGTVEVSDREACVNVTGARQRERRNNETIAAINMIKNDTTYMRGRLDHLDRISAELRALRFSFNRIVADIASKRSNSIEMGNETMKRAAWDSTSMEDTMTEDREGDQSRCPYRKSETSLSSTHYQTLPSDCWEIFQVGCNVSGVYYIHSATENSTVLEVYCQMDLHGGGWTVFQNRQDGTLNFFRKWKEYSSGFGDVDGEFWLGLEYIHRLTNSRVYELLIELADFDGDSTYALYDKFAVGSAAQEYPISSLGDYVGNAGNSLSAYNNRKFTTWDRDNDGSKKNLAFKYIGGWWYRDNHHSDLNGPYLHGPTSHMPLPGVYWYKWRGHYSLRKTRMSIRPKVS